MSLVLVGGHDRMHREYKNEAKKNGHKIKVFTQLPAQFGKRIGNPDAVMIFTNTVSHKMIKIAEKEAKKLEIPIYRGSTSSKNGLNIMLKELG